MRVLFTMYEKRGRKGAAKCKSVLQSVIAPRNMIGSQGVSVIDPVPHIYKTIGGVHLVRKNGCIALGVYRRTTNLAGRDARCQ